MKPIHACLRLRGAEERGEGMDLTNRRTEEKESEAEQWIEEIMDEYGTRLLKLSLSYVKDLGQAQEIVQDVFVTCYKQYGKLGEIQSFKAWIYRVTINRSKDWLRSSFFKRTVLDHSFLKTTRSKDPAPDSIVDQKDRSEALAEHVMKLTVRYREVIILFYYEQLSVKEITELLSLNENTVKTRLKRGRELLGTSLERSGFHEE